MNWLDTVKQLAPTVASALGGPLAGAAVAALGSVFGISQPTQDKIAEVITNSQMTPECIAKLKELELQYQNDEKERGFRYEELAFKDRDSARSRDVELAKSGIKNRRADIMFVLAIAVICGLVYIIWADQTINEFMKGIVTLVLGRFLGYLDNIYNFEFGTTRGSRDKDATIGAMASKN